MDRVKLNNRKMYLTVGISPSPALDKLQDYVIELEDKVVYLEATLLGAADYIDEVSFDHNFNDCDMAKKYREIVEDTKK